MKSLSHVQLLATPWTAAHQAPPSMGFARPRVLQRAATAFSGTSSLSSTNYICTYQFICVCLYTSLAVNLCIIYYLPTLYFPIISVYPSIRPPICLCVISAHLSIDPPIHHLYRPSHHLCPPIGLPVGLPSISAWPPWWLRG